MQTRAIITPLSKGSKDESYTIKFPIFLSSRADFKELRELSTGTKLNILLGTKKATIEKRDTFFLLTIGDFKSEDEATEFLYRLGISFIPFINKYKIGMKFNVAPVPIFEDFYSKMGLPFGLKVNEIHPDWIVKKDNTFADGEMVSYVTSIIPEHKQIVEIPAMLGKLTKIIEFNVLSEAFDEAGKFKNPEKIFNNDKLKLALEVFSNAYFHEDRRVTFINLVTVLEILSEPKKADKSVQTLIRKFQKMTNKESERRKTSTGQEKFKKLNDGLSNLLKMSISEAVKKLVYKYANFGRTEQVSNKITGEIYGVRSQLVHTGKVGTKSKVTGEERFDKAYTELEKIIYEVLTNYMSKVADEK